MGRDFENTPHDPQITGQIGVVGDHARIDQIVFAAPAPPTIPLQRPPRVPHFTDRERELERILEKLFPGQVVTLCGAGGIGKTALAAEAVWQLAPGSKPPERFPDGIVFHSFYGRPDAMLALEHIALSFGEEAKPTPAEAALRALAGKRALLVLDGTENTDGLPAVLEVRGGCGVLVTSRARKDALEGWHQIMPLSADDAVILLTKWGDESVVDEQAAQRICELVGQLPLAVRLAGRYLAETGERATEYLSWLEETPLEALAHGQRRQESVSMLLEKSLAQVSKTAQEVLAVVGLLALEPFGRDPLAAALKTNSRRLSRPIGELVNYGLLLPRNEGYAVSHALVHTYARKRCTHPAGVVARLAAHFNALIRELAKLGPQGYHQLDPARHHMMRVLDHCVAHQHWQEAMALVWGMRDYMSLRGYMADWVVVLKSGITAAQNAKHRFDESAFLNSLGLAHIYQGKAEQAVGYCEQALAISRDICAAAIQGSPDWFAARQGETNQIGNLGLAYYTLGQVEPAIEFYEQALSLARELCAVCEGGSPDWMAARQSESVQLSNLATAYVDLEQMEPAIDYYQEALSIDREIQGACTMGSPEWMAARQNEGTDLGILGNAYRILEDYDQAIESYQAALEIARGIGHRRAEGAHLGDLGLAHLELGEIDLAIECFEQALAIDKEIEYRQGEGSHLGNLGNAYRELGEVKRALEYYEEALRVFEELKSPEADWVRELMAELIGETQP